MKFTSWLMVLAMLIAANSAAVAAQGSTTTGKAQTTGSVGGKSKAVGGVTGTGNKPPKHH